MQLPWRWLATGMLVVTLLVLYPNLSQAMERNRIGLALSNDAAGFVPVEMWRAYCAATMPGLTVNAGECRDINGCYLSGVRANLAGAWDLSAQLSSTQTSTLGVYQRGYGLWCQGETTRALEMWQPIAPDVAKRFDALSSTAFDHQIYTTAVQWAELAVAVYPSARANFNLGRARQAVGDLSGALDAYQSAIVLEPENADFLFEAAKVAALLGQDSRAQEWMGRGLTYAPKDWFKWHLYGNYWSGKQNWVKAEDAYRHSVALYPAWAHNNAGLSFALARQGRNKEAREFMLHAVTYLDSPTQIGGYFFVFANLVAQKDAAMAIEFYTRAARATPDNTVFVGTLWNAYSNQGDCAGLARAIAEFEPQLRLRGLAVPRTRACP